MSRYLKKFSNVDTEYDQQIKVHLEKAKKELLSALRIISNKKRMNILFRMASRRTEVEIQGVLSLIDKISIIKPIPTEEKTLSPKEKRVMRRNKGKVETNEVGNGRRNRR